MNRKMTPEKIKLAVELYNQGLGSVAIGERIGVTHNTVLFHLEKAGIKARVCCGRKRESRHDRTSRKAIQYAIERGLMKRPDFCESCGKEKRQHKNGSSGLHAHHDDYNYPLSVRWLCMKCHYVWHTENEAIPRDPNKQIDLSFLYRSYAGRKKVKSAKSKHAGVSWRGARNLWVATIRVDGKNVYLGSSKSEDEAAKIYTEAVQRYFGNEA